MARNTINYDTKWPPEGPRRGVFRARSRSNFVSFSFSMVPNGTKITVKIKKDRVISSVNEVINTTFLRVSKYRNFNLQYRT